MEIVIASDLELISSKISRIANKRINQLVGAFPSIKKIKFYFGRDEEQFYYELTLQIKSDSIYFKKYFTDLKNELLSGIQDIYDQLYIRYENKKSESYYKPIHLICLVEGNKKVAEEIQENLNSVFNTQIVTFSSPMECYYKLKEYSPNLILIDYDFSDYDKDKLIFTNGASAIKAIKRDYKNQQFLMMVNNISEELDLEDVVCITKEKKSIENLPMLVKKMIPDLPLIKDC